MTVENERGWEGGEGGVAEGGDREMGKRTGMNKVSVYMDACVRVWGKGEGGVGY